MLQQLKQVTVPLGLKFSLKEKQLCEGYLIVKKSHYRLKRNFFFIICKAALDRKIKFSTAGYLKILRMINQFNNTFSHHLYIYIHHNLIFFWIFFSSVSILHKIHFKTLHSESRDGYNIFPHERIKGIKMNSSESFL